MWQQYTWRRHDVLQGGVCESWPWLTTTAAHFFGRWNRKEKHQGRRYCEVTENTRLCTGGWQLQKFRFILKFVLHFLCIGIISMHDTKPWIQHRHPMEKIPCYNAKALYILRMRTSVIRWLIIRTGHYLQVSNISRTLVGNEIVDHSAIVRASPVGAAPTTSSCSS